jgi:hypothetical protein
MKRNAFKTSPSIRIPRAAVEKLQESKAQAQAQAKKITRLEARIAELETADAALCKSIGAAAHDLAIYLEALRDLMGFFDKVKNCSGSWVVAEVKRIEEIRLLSLGI